MKSWKLIVVSLICWASAPSRVDAQDFKRFEVQPFIGGTVGGGIPLRTFDNIEYGKVHVKNSLNAGVTFGYNFSEQVEAEFLWRRQYSEGEATGTVIPSPVVPISGKLFNLNIDQYQGNMLYHFASGEAKTKPYLLFGLGASTLRASTDNGSGSFTKFSFGLGGGIKRFFTDSFGVRAEVRWTPTYLYSTYGGVWCNIYGFCWTIPSDTFMNQVDFTTGVVWRF